MDNQTATPRRPLSPSEYRAKAIAYGAAKGAVHDLLTLARNVDGSITLTPAEADKVLALLEDRP